MSWREVVAEVVADHDAGSWALARRAAAGLALAADEGEAALRAAVRALVSGQPSMAAIWNLANATAWATPSGDPAAAARAFIARGEAAVAAAGRQTAALLGAARRVVTVSASGAVEAALASWPGPALVLESRPRGEGLALARRLAGGGRSVTLAVDAAGRALLETGDVVLLGADSVTPAGVSNKIGSWLLAAGARARAALLRAGGTGEVVAGAAAGGGRGRARPARGAGRAGRGPGRAQPLLRDRPVRIDHGDRDGRRPARTRAGRGGAGWLAAPPLADGGLSGRSPR